MTWPPFTTKYRALRLSSNFDWRDWRVGGRVFVFRRAQGVSVGIYIGPLHVYAEICSRVRYPDSLEFGSRLDAIAKDEIVLSATET